MFATVVDVENLWVFVFTCERPCREGPYRMDVHIESGLVEAGGEHEARGRASEIAGKMYPPGDGWKHAGPGVWALDGARPVDPARVEKRIV